MAKALEGLRVIDFTVWFQGPVAAQYLADFGAEVIKVEPEIDVNAYDKASALYAKGAALWNLRLEGFDSADVAMKYFNKSIEVFETAEAYTARGQLKVQISKMPQGLEDYNRAIEIKPEFSS